MLRPPDTHLPPPARFRFRSLLRVQSRETLPRSRAARAERPAAREARSSTYAAVPSDRTSSRGGAAFVTHAVSRERSRAFNRDLSREGSRAGRRRRARPPAPGASPAPPRTVREPPPFLFRRRFFSSFVFVPSRAPSACKAMPRILRRSASSLARAVSAASGASARHSGGAASPPNRQKDSTKRSSVSPTPSTPTSRVVRESSSASPRRTDARNRGLHTVAPATKPHTSRSSYASYASVCLDPESVSVCLESRPSADRSPVAAKRALIAEHNAGCVARAAPSFFSAAITAKCFGKRTLHVVSAATPPPAMRLHASCVAAASAETAAFEAFSVSDPDDPET